MEYRCRLSRNSNSTVEEFSTFTVSVASEVQNKTIYRVTPQSCFFMWTTTSIYGPLSGTIRVSQYQKESFTHSPHTYRDHRPSFINFLHLPVLQSIASSLFSLSAWQFSAQPLSPGPLWSSSGSGTLHFTLYTFFYPIIIFFSQHTPTPSQPVLL